MKYLITILFFLFSSLSFCQSKNLNFSNDSYSAEFKKENGMYQGKYISKYANGKTKSEGEFKNNMRIGVWKVYDTSGIVIQSRTYQNGFEYTRNYPRKAKTGPANLFDTSVYVLKYNSENYIDYFPLQERMVLFNKRIWRSLDAKENKLLFGKNNIHDELINFLKDTTKNGYCSKVDDFKTKMKSKEIEILSSKNYQIISYKIKEDYFYDIERGISETRIIGICPVGINKSTKDTSDLCWIYFPSVRTLFASIKITDKNNPLIKSMDDLFFFRYFSSEIYKEANVYDTDLFTQTTSPEELNKKRLEIEIGMMEMEHDIWLGGVAR